MRLRAFELLLATLSVSVAACGDATDDGTPNAGSGGAGAAKAPSFGGASFNQCGVAAPLPSDAAGCTPVTAPTIVNFDDYAGTAIGDYGFSVNAVRGAVLHVGDGSDAGGTSVIATEMVPGEDGTGYALQISNTNATNWGGLLMLYFSTPACLDARAHAGLEFSVKGSSPSGRFGVTLGMLDTIPTTDNGLCNNPISTDCKDAAVESTLPIDAATWTKVRLPFDSLTPGVGSGLACVPVTGQNVVRIVIQPFMSYPPPDFMLVPGPYTLAVDDLGFY